LFWRPKKYGVTGRNKEQKKETFSPALATQKQGTIRWKEKKRGSTVLKLAVPLRRKRRGQREVSEGQEKM